VAVVNGAAGARKVNVYKYIIDYHTGYDETNATATNQGDDTYTKTYLDSDYSAMSYTCDTKSIDLTAASTNETPSQMVTITNGEYAFGRWYGVITGEDGDAFTVSNASNNAFSTSANVTVSFTPKSNRSTYNATLRLFSPLASTKSESNDIVIPITATYSGELTEIDNIDKDGAVKIVIEDKFLVVENCDVAKIEVYTMSGFKMKSHNNVNRVPLDNVSGVLIAVVTDTQGNVSAQKIRK
jgi:hypothetical protein